MSTVIVWFRRDLRLADNPALTEAARRHERVVALYVHAPGEEGEWAPGAASRWWLHHSLEALDASLARQGGRLEILRGRSIDGLRAAIEATGAAAVYFNRLYEPKAIERDKSVRRALEGDGIEVKSFNAALWVEPWDVATKQDEPYRVFTPFWRNARTRIDEIEVLPEPPLRLPQERYLRDGPLEVADLGLLPKRDWARGFAGWTPGEKGAHELLALFADDAVGHYVEGRDLPARHGTSRLSPHLHWGEISPAQVAAGLRSHAARRPKAADIEPYLRQLGWREFAHHLLYHFPRTPKENFNPKFDAFHWAKPDAHALRRWKKGHTGIPIVDAGMRELWATGWMHNRVRMLVASLLTKNLRQHWVLGEKWFWDTLVDADLANNAMGWQWVAGSGADAAPYFRIFNPVAQSEKFDPEGAYIRRWVPELAKAPGRLVHAPWEDETFLESSGYPPPIVDLKASRDSALMAYQSMRGGRAEAGPARAE
ncbi:deoxyribodipyrimidine photo-lyase [Luteibacter jiangsuensis]|uniref:Deoxyribodipyrimidine photo-lyase n=1 Tax=Luteibacter jiangsuensis TaxID=637577 RepID=A0ABT9SWY8_9GAMM|nr:deoxyribodipyrimidine photo-lyase [Luteibacter jiangsuensis]MDQ0008482.1 deoxyribodipyrimidine photo-lyase [Luteibacter jiangsuensis]